LNIGRNERNPIRPARKNNSGSELFKKICTNNDLKTLQKAQNKCQMAEIALENCCREKALFSQCKKIWGYLQWIIAC
jgi:hypothetical protein